MAAPEKAAVTDRPSAAARSSWPVRRIGAVAWVTLVQGLRMRLWILAPLAVLMLIAADASSPRFDPIFEGIPAAVSTTLFVMAVLAVLVGVFFATYAIPSEIESKAAYTVCAKPLSALEFVAGKTVGMSLLLAALLAGVAVGAYAYIRVRAVEIQRLAGRHVAEARTRVVHPADLNAVEAVAQVGPLQTYRYHRADSGPDFSILDPQGLTADNSASWILSHAGAKFCWDLSHTPFGEWAEAGACEIHLHIASRKCETVATEPQKIVLALVSEADNGPSGARKSGPAPPDPSRERSQQFDVPADGELRIPVLSARAPATAGSIQVPPKGAVEMQLYAIGDGLLVGAGPQSAALLGPEGKTYRSLPEPVVVVGSQRGRQWLAGRSRVPREQASFHFDSVPAGELLEGDVAVELGFSMDSWGPPAIPSAAQATFVNPQTGQVRSFQFTPEGHRSTILYVDRAFWHGGPLEVRLESQTDEDFLGLLPESVRARVDGGPFAVNLAKSTLNVWLYGSVIVAFGVFLSTRFMWFVSVLGGAAFVIVAFFRDFVRRATIVADIDAALLRWGHDWPNWLHWPWVVNHLLPPLPSLQPMLPGEEVRMGQAMSMAELGDAFLWAAVAVALLVFLAGLLFRHREVAS